MANTPHNGMITNSDLSPLILALECASDASSAAIRLPSGDIIQNLVEARHGHAERLTGQIKDVVRQVGCNFSDITHISAGCGPGSFTGIRVCLAAATGLLVASTAKPVGISMSEALLHAHASRHPGIDCLAVLDSRRQSVYAQRLDSTKIEDWDEATLQQALKANPNLQLIGLLPDGWEQRLPNPDRFRRKLPSAELVANLAATQIFANAPLMPFEPAYLAPPKLGPKKASS